MARYIIVEISDDDTAEGFVRFIEDTRLRGLNAPTESPGTLFRVVGIFQKPNPEKMCQCSPAPDRALKTRKHRWRACPTCKLPKRGWQTYLNNLYYGGIPPQGPRGLNMFLTVREHPDSRPGEPDKE